jgi:hypothetical protein
MPNQTGYITLDRNQFEQSMIECSKASRCNGVSGLESIFEQEY